MDIAVPRVSSAPTKFRGSQFHSLKPTKNICSKILGLNWDTCLASNWQPGWDCADWLRSDNCALSLQSVLQGGLTWRPGDFLVITTGRREVG